MMGMETLSVKSDLLRDQVNANILKLSHIDSLALKMEVIPCSPPDQQEKCDCGLFRHKWGEAHSSVAAGDVSYHLIARVFQLFHCTLG